ncbi:MAG: class II glutamine amidotransferase [Caldivirga sp.]|uniref:class II glutamine amidotransferase n=1 Tax=Caldivirga sp. TaxID=2080243 RepID=UPI003D0E7C40
MCRMLVMIGHVVDFINQYGDVVNGLIKAASNDPYGSRLYGEAKHSDGWGKVTLLGRLGGEPSLTVHRSVNPIYLDSLPNSPLSGLVNGDGVFIEMIHARAASTGTPINLFSTHPVHAVTSTGDEVYMIHNGSFRKEELIKVLGLGGWVETKYNDTFVANLALARRVSSSITIDDLRWLLGFMRTGANLGIMLVKQDMVQVIVGGYHARLNDGKDKERDDYYRLYWCRVGESSLYASSTIVDYYKPHDLANCEPLNNGEYHSYNVNLRTGEVEFNDRWLISKLI